MVEVVGVDTDVLEQHLDPRDVVVEERLAAGIDGVGQVGQLIDRIVRQGMKTVRD